MNVVELNVTAHHSGRAGHRTAVFLCSKAEAGRLHRGIKRRAPLIVLGTDGESVKNILFYSMYWRDKNDEVDFVLERRGKIIGLEVKSGATQSAGGMNAFQKQINPDKVLLIGSSGISWQDFLRINPVSLF